MKKTLFLDTMIFLHCVPLSDIDFCELLNVEDVKIVVPRVIFRELEKHKVDYNSSRLRDRSQKALKLLREHCGTGKPLRKNTQVEFMKSLPSIDMDACGLDRSLNDDVLIACVKSWKIENPSEDVLLVTHDTGATLTCRHLDVDTLELPEKYRLPHELNESEKEAQRLRKELQKIQNALPRIAVGFDSVIDNGSPAEMAEFELTPIIAGNSSVVAERMLEVAESVPDVAKLKREELDASQSDTSPEALKGILNTMSISDSEYERYGREREEYLRKYEKFLRTKERFQESVSRSIRFSITVANLGTSPADDVDIHIHFPDGFSLFTEKTLPRDPQEPLPPHPPRTMQQLAVDRLRPILNYLPQPSPAIRMPNISNFSMKRTQSYDIDDHCDRVKQMHEYTLPEFYLFFDTLETISSFNCTYKITVANLPEPVVGSLNFVVSKAV